MSTSEEPEDAEPWLVAWQTNQTINAQLIAVIEDEGWSCTLSKRGGRTVGRQFAHLHDNRVRQVAKRAKLHLGDLEVFPTKALPTQGEVHDALASSAAAVSSWLADLVTGAKGVRAFQRGLPTTLAYLIAHEAHHRGAILLTLKTCGHAIPKDLGMGIWGWDQL